MSTGRQLSVYETVRVPVAKKLDSLRSQRSVVDELPEILEERQISLRALARSAEVDPAHLRRVLGRQNSKTPSAELCRRLALALDLPADYWPEYRERVVIDQVRTDPALRDELYQRLHKRG